MFKPEELASELCCDCIDKPMDECDCGCLRKAIYNQYNEMKEKLERKENVMTEIEKIEYVSSKLPYGYEILVRNNQSDRFWDHEHKWLVHVGKDYGYTETNEGVITYKSQDLYNQFGNALNQMLDEAIVIVDKEFNN